MCATILFMVYVTNCTLYYSNDKQNIVCIHAHVQVSQCNALPLDQLFRITGPRELCNLLSLSSEICSEGTNISREQTWDALYAYVNLLTAKLFNWNFHPLKVVSLADAIHNFK